MTNERSAIEAVESWIAERLPTAATAHGSDFDRETVLFRVQLPSGNAPELEISREVLADVPPDAIVSALETNDVMERMNRDPSVRIQYFSSGIHHFETRFIDCDGRRYRIVRDSQHNVTIFDSEDRRLAKAPQQMLVMGSSIFRKSASEWCMEILSWRGKNQ